MEPRLKATPCVEVW